MLAKQIASHRDIFCLSDTPLPTVFQILSETDCQCVAIVESLAHKNPIGAVTEHDICQKTIRDGLNPQRLTAARVMNGNIITVSGQATVEECAELLARTNSERLFVVDENGAYAGILTDQNLGKGKYTLKVHKLLNEVTVCPVISQELHLAH